MIMSTVVTIITTKFSRLDTEGNRTVAFFFYLLHYKNEKSGTLSRSALYYCAQDLITQ